MNVPPLLLGSGTQTQCYMNAGFVTFPRPHSKGFLWDLLLHTPHNLEAVVEESHFMDMQQPHSVVFLLDPTFDH